MKKIFFAGNEGFAILTVVFVMVVFAILGVATVSIISTSSQTAMDEELTQQAISVANAGVSYTAETLSGVADWSTQTGVTKTFGPGSFTTTITCADPCTSVTVRSDGTVGGITRSAQQSLTQGSGLADAFTDAFYSGNNISSGGSSSGVINGDVTAKGTVTAGGGLEINGATNQNDPDAAVPQPIWSYWQSVANTTISGSYTFPSGTYSGIYYITGDVGFSTNVTLNGTIATLGSVSFGSNSNIHITATLPNPAIIAGGSVTFTGTSDSTISGYIFTVSTLTMTGNSDVDVTGGMIAGEDITLIGNTDANVTFTSPGDTVPGFTGGEGAEPMTFGTWQEVS
ncbi:MAG: hypothetical protein V2A66_04025 [Pseudomonadota bacterium]